MLRKGWEGHMRYESRREVTKSGVHGGEGERERDEEAHRGEGDRGEEEA